MTECPAWWQKPRDISVVVDNESWILPYAEQLVSWCNEQGDHARLCRTHDDVMCDGVAFYLGCVKITPPVILERNHRNLVVHESDLPKGRGYAPMTWLILEEEHDIPVRLIEAAEKADAGDIFCQGTIHLEGHELNPEWRHKQGLKTVELCQNFLQEKRPPEGKPQEGNPTSYERRYPKDSRLDINKTIEEQFNLLRVVNNESYPAFFEYKGHCYRIKIEKCDDN